jgi:hypothetical protein
MKNKEKKELKEQFDLQEDLSSSSEESFNKDLEFQKSGLYTDDPQNMFEIIKMRTIPEASKVIRHLDKDFILGNIKEKLPEPDYLNLMNETIIAFQENFVIKKSVPLLNEKGEPIKKYNGTQLIGYEEQEVLIFDENLRPILDFLEGSLKGTMVMSRAMGTERESRLGKTSFIEKGINKNNNDNKRSW